MCVAFLLVMMPLVAVGFLSSRQLGNSLGDNVQTLAKFGIGDDQRRSEADNISVSRFGLENNQSILRHN